MKEIKRYTIDAMKDYSDCWIDIDEDYTNEHLINHGDYWCKSKDVADLELDHRAVVETMQKRIDELEKYNKKILAELKDYFMYQEKIRNTSENQSNIKWEFYIKGISKV